MNHAENLPRHPKRCNLEYDGLLPAIFDHALYRDALWQPRSFSELLDLGKGLLNGMPELRWLEKGDSLASACDGDALAAMGTLNQHRESSTELGYGQRDHDFSVPP
jgi:hypothetical protein